MLFFNAVQQSLFPTPLTEALYQIYKTGAALIKGKY